MLRKVTHSKSGKKVWALVSKSKPGKVLEYYSEQKPTPETVAETERRIQYFKYK